MKLTKKILLFASVPVVALSIGGAVFAMQPDAPVGKKSVNTATSFDNLPKAIESTDTPEESAPVQTTVAATQPEPEPAEPEAYNPYAKGTSWEYVWDRRTEIGRPLPQNMGGGSWKGIASRLGLTVSAEPVVGAVVDWGRGVAIVNSVNADGTITIQSSPDDQEIVPADRAAVMLYIH